MATYQLNVNGERREATVDPSTPLLWVLREDLKMTGTKFGCGISACGACTVHVGGVATRSCIVPISHVGDRPIVTIEAMAAEVESLGQRIRYAYLWYLSLRGRRIHQCDSASPPPIRSLVQAARRAIPKDRW